ncbi:SCO6745 family protein [Lapillicoccus jejuensis]|uniref:SalK n=1 Tax=Lapillicoccus jejuensis TaxID=402171 RepID=A0A542E5F6_9MICO|nr:hypothetical protein [Lapillicoccus jejuensis]TQJ10573.1 hypothetical protein FB458_3702 [Lapillicoccus jejuensis]
MDYAEARAAFFAPREGETQPLGWTTPARRLRDAIEPIATVCFWSEPSYDAAAARGLDFLSGYVWGRSSVLGEPEGAVAAAAFGVFAPGLVADLYDAGRAACSLTDVRAARVEGVTAALTQAVGDPAGTEGLAETTAALEAAGDAASPLGRPFFAGWGAQPVPDEPWARLWRATSRLRELRGDSHLAALVGEGVDGIQANVLTELWVGWDLLSYTGSRAWDPELMASAVAGLEQRGLVADGALTDAGRELRDRLEAETDRAVQPVIDALGDDLDAHVERLERWSSAVIERGWFPPDPYKRAAG